MAGSTFSGLWRGKKRRMVHKKSRRQSTVPASARRTAHMERTRWRDFTPGYPWKPNLGRRKLGARRKVTVVESVFQWIKVPTGKVRRTTRRT
jgi:hypothetical protein